MRYDEFASGRPGAVRLTATGPNATGTDLTLRLSQVEINVPLDAAVFEVDVPADATPLTLDELRRSGPLGGGADPGLEPAVSARCRASSPRAHAKVNLDLRVLGLRADGYHELRTVFQTIELHDTLTCRHAAGRLRLSCATAGVPLDDSNLVWKAAARCGRRSAGPTTPPTPR